ncbi:MAG: AtpZ/AtpI family protein [Candidatus Saccharimonadales bacterium]|nr:AtpZ/AtpI family protein [Candidatus Saccharimonadales bacterium]
MGRTTNRKSTQDSEPKSSDRSSHISKPPKGLGNHLAETAWRVAVPFLVFSLGGIWLDSQLDSDPLYSVIGVFVALIAVAVVVYKYVNDHFPDTFKRGGGDDK